MSRVKLPSYDRAPELPAEALVAFDEIQRLASLARALDPSLPEHVRFFQRGEVQYGQTKLDSANVPARVVFTADVREDLAGGLQDPNAIDLFDALDKVLPAHITQALRDRLEAATATPSSAGVIPQAFAAAQAAGRVDLAHMATNDPDIAIVSSAPLAPAPLAFRDDAFLADVAALHLTRTRGPGEDHAFDFISRLNTVRQALARDASSLPASRIAATVADIRSLDGVPGEPAFEQRSGQGWIAYSILAGGKGWAGPLLATAPDVASPHAPFRGVSPIVAAVLADDAQAVRTLTEQGVSANVYLSGVPRVLARDHAQVADALGEHFPVISLAAATGAHEAAGALAQAGAMLEVRGSGGLTPLHQAAMAGHEPTVRVLLANRAPIDALSNDNRTPLELAHESVRAVLAAGHAQPTRGPSLG